MTDGGGWQTVVDPREARRRVKEAERKEKAAEDRHRAQQQREAAQAERERKEQELRAARDTSFSIDIDHSALNNKSQGVKKSTTRRRQLKRKKAAQQAPTPEHSNKSLSSTITLDPLKKFLGTLKADSSSTDLQLKRLGEYFETGFAEVRPHVPATIATREWEIGAIPDEMAKPCRPGTTEPVRQATCHFLRRLPESDITRFFWFLICQLAPVTPPELGERVPLETRGTGLQALLQLLIQERGPVVFSGEGFHKNMRFFLAPCKKKHLRPTIQPALPVNQILQKENLAFFTWVFAQAAGYPSVYRSVWFQYLLPPLMTSSLSYEAWLLIIRSFHAFLDDVEEDLSVSQEQIQEDVIAFERLLVLLFSIDDEQEETDLEDVFRQAKELSVFANQKSPREYFSMLLSHAALSENEQQEVELREYVCDLLVECLSRDEECFERWKEVYPLFIPQSNNLLLFILLKWPTLCTRLDETRVKATARSIKKINKEILAGRYTVRLPRGVEHRNLNLKKKNLRVCTVTCRALIRELNSTPMIIQILKWLFLGLLVMGAFYALCMHSGCHMSFCEKLTDCTPLPIPPSSPVPGINSP